MSTLLNRLMITQWSLGLKPAMMTCGILKFITWRHLRILLVHFKANTSLSSLNKPSAILMAWQKSSAPWTLCGKSGLMNLWWSAFPTKQMNRKTKNLASFKTITFWTRLQVPSESQKCVLVSSIKNLLLIRQALDKFVCSEPSTSKTVNHLKRQFSTFTKRAK